MTDKELDRLEFLREYLHKQNYNYYVLSSPVISDMEFDSLMVELVSIENRHPEWKDENSPSQRVGSDIGRQFEQVKHLRPMLSLGNTYSRQEVADFYSRVCQDVGRSLDISCELKLDGISISLIYENGSLVRAVTRGDGSVGDDVTRNVRTIHSVPLKLHGDYPTHLEMRGEIVMPLEGFKQLNEQRLDIGEAPFANPRNAASGSLKMQISSLVAERPLDCMLYFVYSDEKKFSCHTESLDAAKKWGFNMSPHYRLCSTIDEIYAYIDEWSIRRKTLPFDIDGIVLKVNSFIVQQELGLTSKSPRWAVSYKFKAEQAHSRLLEVSYHVGRTGVVTPVANMEPIQLAGTTVKRASLHNIGIIRELDLHTNDMVVIEKGGEIIPKIVGVDKNERKQDSRPICFPSVCPECGTELIREDGEAAYYCPNYSACSPQLIGRLNHFVERSAMDIGQLGDEKVEQLFRSGLVRNIADFYSLRIQDLISLPGYQVRSAKKTIESINNSKSKSYDRVLFAIGIRYVGSTIAKRLATAFPDIDILMSATVEELQKTQDIGERIALSVHSFFSKDENRELVARLRSVGLHLNEENKTIFSDVLGGKQFVVSGVFEEIGREELKEKIASHGGRVMSSISNKTDFVVAGANMGPTKYEKAHMFNVEIIGFDDLLKMIGDTK